MLGNWSNCMQVSTIYLVDRSEFFLFVYISEVFAFAYWIFVFSHRFVFGLREGLASEEVLILNDVF
jgi:hypothetical protein